LKKVQSRIALLEQQLRAVQISLTELREMERISKDVLRSKGVEF